MSNEEPSFLLTANTCTFESNQCGWINTDKDNFDWSRKRGRTPSFGTGPSVDHTTGTNQGYFMYIETSFGRIGDRARLLSPQFKKVRFSLCPRLQVTRCKLQFDKRDEESTSDLWHSSGR